MRRPNFLILLFLLCGLLSGRGAMAAEGAARAVPEYTMKAAYLYNFAQLTDWPAQPGVSDEAFSLCVFGEDEILSALEPLRRKTINGRPVRVLRVSEAGEAKQCHLLYVGEGDAGRGGRLLESLRGSPVLTITDDPRAQRSGAMLLIVPEERRLSFEVNLDMAKRSQLKLSSKLLGLARRVTSE